MFGVAADPVKSGLVTSFNKPNGNATGVAQLNIGLEAKRLQILHEAVPSAAVFAVLINPTFSDAETQLREVSATAAALGRELVVEKASTEDKIDDAFASFARQRANALLVAPTRSSMNDANKSSRWRLTTHCQRSTNGLNSSRRAA